MSNDESTPQSGISTFGCFGMLGVAVLLLVLVFAWHLKVKHDEAEWMREQQERRERQLAEIRAGGSNVNIGDAKMLEMLADDPICRENVMRIWFTMTDLGDPRFRRVGEFVNLTELSFYCCRNTDNVIAAARDVPGIESMFFEGTGVSYETLRSFAEFPNLKSVGFEQVMADARIVELKQLLPDVEIAAFLESEEAEKWKRGNQQEAAKSE